MTEAKPRAVDVHAVLRQLGQIGYALCATLWLGVGYIFAQLAALHFSIAAVVILLSFSACACLSWIRFTASGRKVFTRSRETDWSGTVAVALFLVAFGTAGFAATTTALYDLGVGTTKGGPLHGRDVVVAAYSYYLWHLADAIPLLKVPATLNWKLAHPFTDSVHGALVLVYKVLVVVPLLFAATQFISRLTSDPDSDSPPEPEPEPDGTDET